MNKKVLGILCAIAALVVISAPLSAQDNAKPPLYTYIANWDFPRAQWAAVERDRVASAPILQKAMASGNVVAFGFDTILVHQGDGETHGDWISSNSLAGLMSAMEQVTASGSTTNATYSGATKHWDEFFVAKYYNYKPGTYKNGYGRGSIYALKKDAPEDAVEKISKMLMVPYLEKLLADGVIAEYEIDTDYIHINDPAFFGYYYLCPTADGLDKAAEALKAFAKEHPAELAMYQSMVDSSQHRDFLLRSNATYK